MTLGEVHADARFRGVSLRALYARGRVGDVAAIAEANGSGPDEAIGRSFGGWYLEGGYDITSLFGRGEMTLTPYARWESLDTQRQAARGFFRNPENEQDVLTLGVAFKPIPQTVIKVDWQDVDNEANTGTDQWNVSVGYIF